ncbi:MAG: hypothetical protein QOE77_1762 [Blastocatellia bacterium]|jgi:hypothetical protein|nr:hypothetical protein [Blastocatellia bacterium]
MSLFLLPLLFVLNISSGVVQEPVTSGHPAVAGTKSEPAKTPLKLPAEIKLILRVDDMPGIDNAKSFWEATYEIRVADWQTIVERTKAGQDPEETGLTIFQSSFAHLDLAEKKNRNVVISVPVAGVLLERLQQQSQKPQAFLLRSSVRFFDARLDRNFALKVNRIWRFKLFPDGEAAIAIRIEPDGSFSINGPVPKDIPGGYMIVGAPATKKP